MSEIITVGLDLAKNVFQVHGSDCGGRVVLRKKLRPEPSSCNIVQGIREIVLVNDLHKQGLSISAIARKVGCDRKTVRKYPERGLDVPVYPRNAAH